MLRSPVIAIAPDSFKGSVSAPDAAPAIARGIARVWPNADIRTCPMADGGEGTLDAILSRGGEGRSRIVAGAAGTDVHATYGWLHDGATAVIEVAQVVGLTDASGAAVDVEQIARLFDAAHL